MLGQDKLITTEVLISKALIDSYLIHDEFVSVNNTLREYKKMKEKIKNPETSLCVTYYIKTMETYCISCKKNTANENSSARKLSKTDQYFCQTVLLMAKKNWLLFTIKTSAILTKFEMISLKLTRLLTNFYWMEIIVCQNCI